MSSSRQVNFFLVVFTFFSVLPGWSFSKETTHQHGVADVEIAYEGKELKIRIQGPADNLLGFERPPLSKRDKMIVAKSLDSLLRKVKFDLPELCRPDSVVYKGAGFRSDENFELLYEPADPDQTHSDVEVLYEYLCNKDKVKEVNFKTFFSTFQKIKTIKVALKIGDQEQSSQITPKRPSVKFP